MKARTDYKICPYCGASLDIGEKCDCQGEKEANICPVTNEKRREGIIPYMPVKRA